MQRLFPNTFDRSFPGHWLGTAIFAALTTFHVMIACVMIFNPYGGAVGADGIPVESYGKDGAAAFLSLFSTTGVYLLAFDAIAVVVLLRYRAMIPLIALLYLGTKLGNKVLDITAPLPGRPPSGELLTIGNGLIVGFVLVLVSAFWPRGSSKPKLP